MFTIQSVVSWKFRKKIQEPRDGSGCAKPTEREERKLSSELRMVRPESFVASSTVGKKRPKLKVWRPPKSLKREDGGAELPRPSTETERKDVDVAWLLLKEKRKLTLGIGIDRRRRTGPGQNRRAISPSSRGAWRATEAFDESLVEEKERYESSKEATAEMVTSIAEDGGTRERKTSRRRVASDRKSQRGRGR
ncbi:unnamed protein product [Linum trigynum]